MPLHADNMKIKIIASLMLLITGILILNKALFLHSHKMDNGVVISHSHPYNRSDDKQPYKSHFHSEAEIVFLENSKLVYPVLIMYLVLIIPANGITYYCHRIIRPEIMSTEYTDCRAPPVL